MAAAVVVDDYDSFTWNLVHLIGPLVERIRVVRNDIGLSPISPVP